MSEKITLEFTESEANIMMGALGKIPYEKSAQLIANLQAQFQKQMVKSEENNPEKLEKNK